MRATSCSRGSVLALRFDNKRRLPLDASRTIGRWDVVVHYAVSIAGLVYALVGYIGFFSLDTSDANYFAAGPTDDTFLTIARIVMGISVICTYPIDCFVAANAVRRIMRRYRWQRKQAYRRGRLNGSMQAERCTDVSSMTVDPSSEPSVVNSEAGVRSDSMPKIETSHYSFRHTTSHLLAESEIDIRLLREPSIYQVMESRPTLLTRLKELSIIVRVFPLPIVRSLLVCLLGLILLLCADGPAGDLGALHRVQHASELSAAVDLRRR